MQDIGGGRLEVDGSSRIPAGGDVGIGAGPVHAPDHKFPATSEAIFHDADNEVDEVKVPSTPAVKEAPHREPDFKVPSPSKTPVGAESTVQKIKAAATNALQTTQQAVTGTASTAYESVAGTASTAYEKLDSAGIPQKLNEHISYGKDLAAQKAAALKEQANAHLSYGKDLASQKVAAGTDYLYSTADRVAHATPEDINQSSLARIAAGVLLLSLACGLIGINLKLAIAVVALLGILAYLSQFKGGEVVAHTRQAFTRHTGAFPSGPAMGPGALGGKISEEKAHQLHDKIAHEAADVATHREPPLPNHGIPQGIPAEVDHVHGVISHEAAKVAQQYLPKPEIKE